MILLQNSTLQTILPDMGLEAKLLLTVLLCLGFALAVRFAVRLRDRIDYREHVVKGALGLVLATLVAILLALLYTIWRSEVAGISAFSFLNVANPTRTVITGILTFLLFIGVYVLTGFLKDGIFRLAEESDAVTQHQSEVFFRSTQVTIYVIAGLIALSIWNVNLGGLLVGAGFLGIVLGLAAQQTLGSLIAGFVLMFARPFEIGDWVEIGDREGIVTEISIVNTRIQTFDGEYAMIPNDIVSSSEIINRTRKGRLRLRVDVGVDYETDLEHATDTAMDALRDVDEILSVPQPQVMLKEFGDSAIVLQLRFWIDKPSSRRRWRARTAVLQSVKAAFDRENIKIPFPQRELMGRSEAGGFRVREDVERSAEPGDGADE